MRLLTALLWFSASLFLFFSCRSESLDDSSLKDHVGMCEKNYSTQISEYHNGNVEAMNEISQSCQRALGYNQEGEGDATAETLAERNTRIFTDTKAPIFIESCIQSRNVEPDACLIDCVADLNEYIAQARENRAVAADDYGSEEHISNVNQICRDAIEEFTVEETETEEGETETEEGETETEEGDEEGETETEEGDEEGETETGDGIETACKDSAQNHEIKLTTAGSYELAYGTVPGIGLRVGPNLGGFPEVLDVPAQTVVTVNSCVKTAGYEWICAQYEGRWGWFKATASGSMGICPF